MKIIVTGGYGFIGSNLIKSLLTNKNYKILNLDKVTETSIPLSLKKIKSRNYYFRKIDICNYNKLKRIIFEYKPNIIFHLAAETHVDNSITRPKKFIDTNIVGTFNLIDICKNLYAKNNYKNFKFIHVSTDEVYGSLKKNAKSFTEKSSFKPNSPYASSKASSDLLVRAWIKTFKFPAIITNCSNNYGPWQYPEKLIPLVIAKCILKLKIPVYGNGLNERDWLYVGDHVRALIHISKFGRVGDKYNIGMNRTLKNINLVKKICSKLDTLNLHNKKDFKHETLISFVKDRKGHDFKYSVNSAKLKNLRTFKYEKNFDKTLTETVLWYLENKKWLIDAYYKKFKR
ncbi:dTDP-glucose 4,6-dehydratase [Pelagibacteraceae bacterium]|nr:dTDP-glucose 4,6-dehydratase [Pelagibacteraceae bacterium]